MTEKIEDFKRDLRDIRTLKTHAQNVSRLQKELRRANEEVADAEKQLSATGSTKTLDDVQNETLPVCGRILEVTQMLLEDDVERVQVAGHFVLVLDLSHGLCIRFGTRGTQLEQ